MKAQQIPSLRVTAIAYAILSTATALLDEAGAATANAYTNQDILTAVQVLYNLDENQAIKRILREHEAAQQYHLVKQLDLGSYAGSWFDDQTLTLQVAITDPTDVYLIERIGANPIIVTHSLKALETARERALDALADGSSANRSVRKASIDVRSNRVIIGVKPGYLGVAESILESIGPHTGLLYVVEVAKEATFSTGDVRAADGTRNATWAQQFGGTWPCSIGASVVGGYITAGHCGEAQDQIETLSGETLGVVQQSDLPGFANTEDGAWVDTDPGWTPKPLVNGYNDGIFSVNAEFAGMLESPIGTTACRYGQTTFGPHCGQISDRNVGVTISDNWFTGMIETSGICTNDGDSGGPLVSGSAQMQGTLSGGDANSCPDDPGDTIYFQPVKTTLDRFGRIMRTPHGWNAPTINIFSCPDSGNSGNGQYWCEIKSYDSQGEVNYAWTTSTGASSTSSFVADQCSQGEIVSVDVSISNTYGTTYDSASFECPMGTIN